jgi:peptidyl-dipeptidase Dcp
MKSFFSIRARIAALAACVALAGCGGAPGAAREESMSAPPQSNPLLAELDTPLGVPPFDLIEDEHYRPAFEEAIASHEEEIAAIADSEQPPSFANTVEALDYSGRELRRVANVFFAQNSAATNDRIQQIAKETAPELSAHQDAILMNERLFERIEKLHESRGELGLSDEQLRLLEETCDDFVRGGARLAAEGKQRMAEINSRLAVLSLEFGENLLAENNEFQLVIEDEKELAGLPDSSIAAAAEAASEADLDGKWVFTVHKPSWIPFMQFAQNRDHRKTMFEAYTERGNHGDERDNKEILVEMARLRVERAHLLGYPSHAHYVLEDNMAGTPAGVRELLDRLWKAALPVTQSEAEALSELLAEDVPGGELRPWDWFYYTEKRREREFDLSDEELRPYFALENVQRAAFDVAGRLYGLEFVEREDLPVYHEDVKAFEVREADGSHVGVLYVDYFPRESKRQGAWMTEYRGQERRDGERIAPVVVNVFNFPEPSGEEPALLGLEEVETLFHEFGHGLHGLLSDVTYPGLAGTGVARDFVELPSQFMEHWAVEPSVMKGYARHWESGEPISDELIEKIREARHFNQGFATTEYLAASYLDLFWHGFEEDPGEGIDVVARESEQMEELGLIPEIVPRYRSTYFAHVFAGGYSSGYYSYIWSAVLDSDAFAAFEECEELFDRETATRFRELILARGNSADPMELYVEFRGAEPGIEPLLKKRGLLPGDE